MDCKEKVIRILLAEDHEDSRLLLQAVLDKAGYDCEVAEDGEEAMEKFEHAERNGTPFDLLLLDAAMPKKCGFEVAAEVHKIRDIPVIMLTALNEPLIRAHAEHANIKKLLDKPIAPEELVRAIEQALQ